ncbi:MAG: CPXCG motif-containing cysteine-rich protein [Candidatus Hydrogenedentota bacterium]|nr:MAG: CPXCG motif-containing cysteine-rich protein [Candidatus Hydrogenedentota bacterium]
MLITANYFCNYCGARNTISVDPTGGANQEYIEDCEVCCRPNLLRIRMRNSGRSADVQAERADD